MAGAHPRRSKIWPAPLFILSIWKWSTLMFSTPVSILSILILIPPAAKRLPQVWSALDDQTAAVIVQSPNFFGCVENVQTLADGASGRGTIDRRCDRTHLTGPAETPGACRADIVVAEGQSFGVPLSFGGPMLVCSPLATNMPDKYRAGWWVKRMTSRGGAVCADARRS